MGRRSSGRTRASPALLPLPRRKKRCSRSWLRPLSPSSRYTPRAAVARLKEVLEQNDLAVYAEIEGTGISPRLPCEYTLLLVGAPAAAAKAFAADPDMPAAIALPVAVHAAQGGSVIAAPDPVAQVWLYGNDTLNKLQRSLRSRVDALFAQL